MTWRTNDLLGLFGSQTTSGAPREHKASSPRRQLKVCNDGQLIISEIWKEDAAIHTSGDHVQASYAKSRTRKVAAAVQEKAQQISRC
jgi:hypothetical protein